MLVSEMLRKDPFCGDLFIFRSKRSDRIKILTVGRHGSRLVFEALGERPFHMAADLRWNDYAERHTTLTFAGTARIGERCRCALWIDHCAQAECLVIHAGCE